MPDYSYYAGKSDLLQWVNDLLGLQCESMEEFANGAVYCQILDAYYSNTVLMRKVNFRARKEYEIFTNYKHLQAALNSAKLSRELNLENLMKGSQGDILELLQWLFMVLHKKKGIDEYDAKSRRRVTVNGGTNKVPLPIWRSAKFDVFGKAETSKRLVNTAQDNDSVPRSSKTGSHHRTVRRSPTHGLNLSGRMSGSVGSAKRSITSDPHPDPTPSPDSRKSNSMSRSTSTIGVSPPTSPISHNGHLSPKELTIPRLKLETMGTPTASPKRGTASRTFSQGSGRSSMLGASQRSVMTPDFKALDKSASNNGRNFELLLGDIVPACLKSASQAVSTFQQATQTLRMLVQQIGTDQDTYACRAKLHSLRDAMTTLMRHTNLLLDDLAAPVAKLKDLDVAKAAELVKETSGLMEQLESGKKEFHDLVIDLATGEQAHPVPRGTAASGISDQLRERTESDNLDGALRKVGAAKAALARALQKVGGLDLRMPNNQSEDVQYDMDPLDQSLTETDSSNANNGGAKIEEAEAFISVGYPDGANYPGHNEVYKGQYINGKKCGYGSYTFVNGDVYQGEFKDDEMHGYGLYTFSHEGHYEGQWVMGVYEGVGTETFALGSTYHGQYTEGSRNGWGVCRYYNGDYYEGQWREGLREGRGMQQCTDDSNFVGDYLYGKRHGYGVYNFPNGDKYYGEYVNDIPHGHGVYRFSNGQKYEGQWQAGKKHGYCVYTVETNGVWERWAGEWEEGRPVWVESLSRWDNDLSGMPEDLKKKMEQALNACKKAQESGEIGTSRAEEHWQTDGRIQRSIRDVVRKADKAAIMARQAQKKALEVAARLDTAESRKKAQDNNANKRPS